MQGCYKREKISTTVEYQVPKSVGKKLSHLAIDLDITKTQLISDIVYKYLEEATL